MSNPKHHIALYPGTFDGLTNGHLDIVHRAAKLFDKLTVAVAQNEKKTPVFSIEERIEILKAETTGLNNVAIATFNGLTMNYAEEIGAHYVIRGIRVVSDFEMEYQMALMNHALNPRIETLFMFPSPEHLFISSSVIKEVLLLGGDVRQFVPATTEKFLRKRFSLPPRAE